MSTDPPRVSPSSAVKVRLLQDAVYSEDGDLWEALLRYRSPHLEHYFRDIGLELVVSEEDGFAFLRQMSFEDGDGPPRLVRREKLSKGVAMVGVVLRERLLRFDEQIHDETRLTVTKSEIVEAVSTFFPEANDEPKAAKRVDAAIAKAEELGLIRQLGARDGGGDERYEVRRIIKARFPADTLASLRDQLEANANTTDN